ncbi:MAG: hypothetical protein PHR65_07290 [Syntrophomonadaceae bacterium]|nr:hypothetical protein [Syntrophomonadaceae bacterium]
MVQMLRVRATYLHSIRKMKSLVVNSGKLNEGDSIPVVPFIFDALYGAKPSKFEICCMIENIKYVYGFSRYNEDDLELEIHVGY